MKTEEEIEKLAKQYIKDNTGDHYVYCGFVDGYTQCQEDMAKDLEMHILVNEHDWSRNPQAQLRDYINSLNKQD